MATTPTTSTKDPNQQSVNQNLGLKGTPSAETSEPRHVLAALEEEQACDDPTPRPSPTNIVELSAHEMLKLQKMPLLFLSRSRTPSPKLDELVEDLWYQFPRRGTHRSQRYYELHTPKKVPAGTTVTVHARAKGEVKVFVGPHSNARSRYKEKMISGDSVSVEKLECDIEFKTAKILYIAIEFGRCRATCQVKYTTAKQTTTALVANDGKRKVTDKSFSNDDIKRSKLLK